MQRNSGLQRWLKIPFLYNLFQEAIGGNALRRKFVQSHVRAKPGDKIIDIGCGPAQILPWLPAVDYLGFDVNPAWSCMFFICNTPRGNLDSGGRRDVRVWTRHETGGDHG